MLEPTYLHDHILIAMPNLLDPNFQQTVTYICQHDESGALGIVVNRPLSLTFGELLEHLEVEQIVRPELAASKVFSGGPVRPEQGFVIHTPLGDWDATLKVTDQIGLTTSRDIVQALACDKGPSQSLLALGYAGWGPGQLEQEMIDNAWLSCAANAAILFEIPIGERWTAAAAQLGVDLTLLSGDAGHA